MLLVLSLVVSVETLRGHVDKVRDGDTIVVSGVPIRLQGVAAPEMKEKWGKQAMQRIVAGQRLRCEMTGEKTHDRKVGGATWTTVPTLVLRSSPKGQQGTAPDTRVGGTRFMRPRRAAPCRFRGTAVNVRSSGPRSAICGHWGDRSWRTTEDCFSYSGNEVSERKPLPNKFSRNQYPMRSHK